ncbi:hypothetical protein C8Q78DRAFT_1148765 [Trametes maxima]|nr:hypothetical protein C8Q78DRAFT_1148765 [Trametes maxima]
MAACYHNNDSRVIPSTSTVVLAVPTIHRLPVELLVEVFSWTQLTHSALVRPRHHWTQLMLVCQRWRIIVVDTPRFWTTIDFADNFEWARESLSRSRNAAIDINLVGLEPKHLETAVGLLDSHALRLRSLVFYSNDTPDDLGLLIKLLFSHLPALEELTISLTLRSFAWPEIDFGLACDKHPRLHRLILEGVTIPREPQFYSRMKTLVLHKRCPVRGGAFMKRLVDILDNASELEELDLSHYEIEVSGDPQEDMVDLPSAPLIVLPKLRSFYMEHSVHTMYQILAALNIPPTCEHFHLRAITSVWGGGVGDDGTLRSVLVRLIPSHLRHLLHNAERLSITMSSRRYVIRDPGPLRSPPSQTASRADPDFPIDRVHILIANSGTTSLYLSLEDILHVASLTRLTSLTVNSERQDIASAAWEALLRSCPQLGTLIVSELLRGRPTHIFEALTVYESDERPSPVLCPALRSLSVESHLVAEGSILACVSSRTGRAPRLRSLSLRLVKPSFRTIQRELPAKLVKDELLGLCSLVDELVMR